MTEIRFYDWIRRKLRAAGVPRKKIEGRTGHLQGALIHLLPAGTPSPIDHSRETYPKEVLEMHFGQRLQEYIDVNVRWKIAFQQRPVREEITVERPPGGFEIKQPQKRKIKPN